MCYAMLLVLASCGPEEGDGGENMHPGISPAVVYRADAHQCRFWHSKTGGCKFKSTTVVFGCTGNVTHHQHDRCSLNARGEASFTQRGVAVGERSPPGALSISCGSEREYNVRSHSRRV